MTKPPDFIELKTKITHSKDFTPDERALLLDCLNLGDYNKGEHQYPKFHGPGTSPWATGAWAILDQLTPGKLSRTDRFMLGGMLAGALREMFEAGIKNRG